MKTYLPRQPDTYPLPRMAYDAMPRRLGRDEDLDDALTLNPAEGLRKYIDGMLGTDHPHRAALMRMIDQLAGTDSEPELEAEDRRRAMDAARAHDGSHAGRARAAAHARSIAADASLRARFPSLSRIRSA